MPSTRAVGRGGWWCWYCCMRATHPPAAGPLFASARRIPSLSILLDACVHGRRTLAGDEFVEECWTGRSPRPRRSLCHARSSSRAYLLILLLPRLPSLSPATIIEIHVACENPIPFTIPFYISLKKVDG
jgi:hypothetical protein